jgi:hypothetical protein
MTWDAATAWVNRFMADHKYASTPFETVLREAAFAAYRAGVESLRLANDELRQRIETGRAAHNEDRVHLDSLARENERLRSELANLRSPHPTHTEKP